MISHYIFLYAYDTRYTILCHVTVCYMLYYIVILYCHIVYYNIKNLSLSRYTSEARSLPAAAYIGTATPHYYMCTEKNEQSSFKKDTAHYTTTYI